MAYRYGRRTARSGCLKGTISGCSSLLFFFLLIIVLISSIDFPELDFEFGKTERADYQIDMDSLTNERIINASYSWKFVSSNLSRKKYDLTFKLLASEVKKAMDLIDRIGSMSLEELGLNPRYNYDDPYIQAQYVWAKIYRIVYEKSFPQLKTISEGFNQVFKNDNISGKDRALFLISFIQNMKYDRPGGNLDLFAPIGTLAKKFGDCDTKAILLYALLERIGIDCAMMWSPKYKHAVLGVNVSARGDYKNANGKKYYFLETTYPGWAIGDLPPEFKNKRFWIIDEIDTKEKITSNKEEKIKNEWDERPNRKTTPKPAIL